ncbi:unnamed protein product [Closterium sp. NIES-65]|nr:unnamed protein product [Closterium sp. NIES-65]
MRRRPGVAGLQTAAAVRGQYRSLGEDVAKQRQESLRQQLETFRGFLMDFAQKHKSDISRNPAFRAQFHAMFAQCGVDPLAIFLSPLSPCSALPPILPSCQSDIRSNPAFRAQFHAMCAQCGVDPLASNKGFWNELLGFGDFYYELEGRTAGRDVHGNEGVQLIETCMATRADNGGLINLEELRRLVAGKRRMPLDALSHDDCMRALATIKVCVTPFESPQYSSTYMRILYRCDGSQRTSSVSSGNWHSYIVPRRGFSGGESGCSTRGLLFKTSQRPSIVVPTYCRHRQSLGGGLAVEKVGATHVVSLSCPCPSSCTSTRRVLSLVSLCHRQSLGGGFAVEKVGATHVVSLSCPCPSSCTSTRHVLSLVSLCHGQSLGGGFAVEKVGATHVVRSLPRELSTDQNDILRLAQVTWQACGCVTIADILSATSWQHGRINDALDALLKEGIAMVDDGDPDGQRRYWFPCFDIAAPTSL